MSRNGSGTYSLPAGNPVVTGTTISTAWANNTLTDIASALTDSVAADGQTPMTGQLDMNSNKIINLTAGTNTGNAVEYDQFIAAFTDPTITGDLIVTGNGEFGGTGYLLIPKGTTAQRPAVPVDGELRYNTTTGQFEGYQGGAWGQLGSGATGGGGDEVFVENARVVTVNYTLSTNKSAESVGPITINSGVTVTIPSAERWVIL
jgi:hypothetical protein